MLPLGIRAPVCADALAGACFCAGRSRRSRRIATWKGPPCGGPFAESVCWCCGYAVDCCNCGTSRASSRSLYERRRLTRWLLDRVRVVGSRRPFLCVGGKEKWFAHLSCGRGSGRAGHRKTTACSGLLVIHRYGRLWASLLALGCCHHYCQCGPFYPHKKVLRDFARAMKYEVRSNKWGNWPPWTPSRLTYTLRNRPFTMVLLWQPCCGIVKRRGGAPIGMGANRGFARACRRPGIEGAQFVPDPI